MRYPFLILVVLAFVGCDDGDGGGGFTSGVETEKKISELSNAEAKDICTAIEASAASLVSTDKICEIIGASIAPTPETCRQGIADCRNQLNSQEREPDDESSDCELEQEAKRAGCDATVGEFEGCVNATFALTRNLLGQISCADAGNPAKLESLQSQVPEGPEDVPACADIKAQCPQLFDESDDGDRVQNPDPVDQPPPGE